MNNRGLRTFFIDEEHKESYNLQKTLKNRCELKYVYLTRLWVILHFRVLILRHYQKYILFCHNFPHNKYIVNDRSYLLEGARGSVVG
jgi:hypothetical protein